MVALLGALWVRERYVDSPTVMASYMNAVHLAEQGRYSEAVAIWQRLIQKDPHFLYPYLQLSFYYTKEGQPEKALPLLNTLIHQNPRFPKAQETLCEACLQLQNIPCAVQAAKAAVAQQPTSGHAHDLLAAAYGMNFDFGSCVRELKVAEQLSPQDASIWLHGANIYQQANNVTATAMQARRCLQLDPHNARAWYLLGWALAEAPKSGNRYDALKALQAAVRLNPLDPLANIELGAVLVQLGRNREAMQVLTHARQLAAIPDPDGGFSEKHLQARARVARLLGLLYLREQNTKKASALFQECQRFANTADRYNNPGR